MLGACTGGHPSPTAVVSGAPVVCHGRPLPIPLQAARPPLEMDDGGCVSKAARDALTAKPIIPALVGPSFRDAILALNQQTHIFPTPTSRQAALWSIGWVAFRSEQFASARGVFQYLHNQAPFGPHAPASLYWAARSAQHLGMGDIYLAELGALVQRFPVDYYSVQASVRMAEAGQMIAQVVTDFEAQRPQSLILAQALSDVGAHKAVRRLLLQVLTQELPNLGLQTMKGFEAIASHVQSNYFTRRFRWERNKRFPEVSHDSIRALSFSFPWSYVEIVSRAARMSRVDADLVIALARQESAFNPSAVSHAGAMGLLQVMPQTAREVLGLGADESEGAPVDMLDAKTSAELGSRYLARMLKRSGGHVEYALASYNAGPAAVTRWRNRLGNVALDVFVEEIPYAETRDYVQRVLAWKRVYTFLGSARRQISTLTQRETKAVPTVKGTFSG